jgi:hypothetical protein
VTSPDLPYTDADLRAEAARQLANLAEDPDFMGVGEAMETNIVPSTEKPDVIGAGRSWDSVLRENADDFERFETAQTKIHDLITGAADLSEWAINLGADDLEPSSNQSRRQAGDDAAVAASTSPSTRHARGARRQSSCRPRPGARRPPLTTDPAPPTGRTAHMPKLAKHQVPEIKLDSGNAAIDERRPHRRSRSSGLFERPGTVMFAIVELTSVAYTGHADGEEKTRRSSSASPGPRSPATTTRPPPSPRPHGPCTGAAAWTTPSTRSARGRRALRTSSRRTSRATRRRSSSRSTRSGSAPGICTTPRADPARPGATSPAPGHRATHPD